MSWRRWGLVGGIVVALVVMVAVAGWDPGRGGGSAVVPATSTTPSGPIPTPRVSAAPTIAPVSTLVPDPTSAPVPSAADTAPPRASGPPRVAYASFLLRVDGDRATVNGLNTALSEAAEAQDTDAVRRVALDILDFVEVERDWLREHPPAECYAAAHAAANAMLRAYGTAAERFIDWATAGGGLDGLLALREAVDAAQVAADSLTSFGQVLEGTTCPT